jgi:Alpha-L-arabinofuranosidase C-terminal domain
VISAFKFPNCTVLTPLQGEYAATSNTDFPTMQGMVIDVWHLSTKLTGIKGSAGEAAFMMGLERNSDIVYS